MAQGDNEVCEDESEVRGQNAEEKTVARRGFGRGHESCPVSSFLPWATAASQAVAVETPSSGVGGHKALKARDPRARPSSHVQLSTACLHSAAPRALVKAERLRRH